MFDLCKWEVYCRNNGMAPIGYRVTPHGTVYFAEGARPPENNPVTSTETQPYYEMAWVVARDGLDVGGRMQVGALKWPLQSQRIDVCMKYGAAEWIARNLDVGRYADT